jgi:hypothetical protein
MTDTPDILAGLVKPGEIERAIWSAMIWAAANNPGFEGAPEYTDRGNSFAETEARAAAARVLASIDADKLRAVVGAFGLCRDALCEIERLYYQEGKDLAWRAAKSRAIATQVITATHDAALADLTARGDSP